VPCLTWPGAATVPGHHARLTERAVAPLPVTDLTADARPEAVLAGRWPAGPPADRTGRPGGGPA
jgi:hypothetical protein